ncbi:hypothetical protein P152DRAFT_471050 [Eremomyces bilateralis CBS 781.70]|uniref:dual-specificity kinase n=1 Tax=Eremomyces bilateralis CBS 781.70 TaxID=1392243 RepID=A0A6G1GC18_9PEZI|nr:uncharacterized protein P152DRAFT_471050 [Eremomyces bilateralis CBS 781.70]KAF1815635.1 hypothetical protein P152DRAFT_471050 [Eremomyces bilateralis CBS 781.70]
MREPARPPLLGPRPLEQQQGKRVISDTSAIPAATRSFPLSQGIKPSESRAPPTQNTSGPFGTGIGRGNDAPREGNEEESFDFLPAVNFDEFHASLTYEPDLNDFPLPGRVGDRVIGATSTQRMVPGTGDDNQFISGPQGGIPRRPSLLRKANNARPPENRQQTTDTTSMAPPSAFATRNRQQSSQNAPLSTPVKTSAHFRSPRKSVGPGIYTPNQDGRNTKGNASSSFSGQGQGSLSRSSSMTKANRRTTLAPGSVGGADTARFAASTRSAKARSLQTGSQSTNNLDPNAGRDGQNVSTQSRSPARSSAQQNHTPSSGNKRMSTMPHVGGLGARTISPTDARRLKRLSTAHGSSAPNTPPTPQPDFTPAPRASVPSPGFVARKSATPNSARATPDHTRKFPASSLNLVSTSSSASLRTGPNVANPRNQYQSTSRLPTPKPRNVHSSAAGELEEVPPVPAIPKAYESPKDNPEHEYFVPNKSATLDSMDDSRSLASSRNNAPGVFLGEVRSAHPMLYEQHASRGNNPRHRRGLTVGADSDADQAVTIQHVNKKTLQPIRLPPLNLLPLSTPTASRIAALPGPSAEVDDRNNRTPPPQRNAAKTPSTPMTASKATFFGRALQDDPDFNPFHLRSSSSQYHLRPDPPSYPSLSPTLPLSIPGNAGSRQITTPFASASLPKNSGEFARYSARQSDEELKFDDILEADAVDYAPAQGPVSQMATKKDTQSAPSVNTSASEEPETPSSATSLRRKLSIGWRRSSSKASHPAQQSQTAEVEEEKQPRKSKDMPPPRMPASATVGRSSHASPSPSVRSRGSLDIRRRKLSISNLENVQGSHDDKPPPQRHERNVIRGNTHPPPYTERANVPRSTSSILTPVHRILGSKNSISTLKARHLDTNLDKDDLAADKVMEKLGSKRRDFESVSRELDDLRKRARPKDSVLPSHALQMVNLNIFERGEIIDYKEVYFCGTQNAKKHVGDLNSHSANFGYDDERGDYNIVLGDHLSYRYEVVDILGKGSFGQVVRCVDHKLGVLVAVKIIRNKKRFHQQALVEVNILQRLREWDPESKHSMISFTQHFYFRGHLCISTELLGMNLYEFIKAYEFKGFPLVLIRRFAKQMLSSLTLLKSRRVIHCDLKPENILLAHPMHSEIKVIDFGSSCFENEKVYTYIQSRFYRSPEVILGMSYGIQIDMWSLGCILAELLTGYPIFPGENEQEQLACIMEIFGPPEKHLIEKSSRKKLFFDSLGKPRVTVSSKGRRRRPSSRTLQHALKCDDDAFLDFIARCLRWDPERRLRPDDALHHEFITGIKRPIAHRSRTQVHGLPMRDRGPNHPHSNISSSSSNPPNYHQGGNLRASNSDSPIKRYNTVSGPAAPMQTPRQSSRPLPEPPATAFRNASTGNAPPRDIIGSSPVKRSEPYGSARRHSTVNGGVPVPSARRGASGGVPVLGRSSATAAVSGMGSALPRASQRAGSGKMGGSGGGGGNPASAAAASAQWQR